MHKGHQLQFDRILFFSDAVFAIAITLLVIDIRLPAGLATEAALRKALGDETPHYVAFVVSFIVIGRFWTGHHRLFGYLKDFDTGLLTRNLLFLMTIAFMPFPTMVVGSYGSSETGVLFYSGWLIVAGLLNRSIIGYIVNHPTLLAAPLTREQRLQMGNSWLPLIIGGTAAAAALWQPGIGLLVLIFLSPLLGIAVWAQRRWREHRAAKA